MDQSIFWRRRGTLGLRRLAISALGFRLLCTTAIICALGVFAAGRAAAQPPQFFEMTPTQTGSREPLTRGSTETPVINRSTSGTAFFVDDIGHMLTVRHAVADCARVLVNKEGRTVMAKVVALASGFDLALIKVPKTLGLAAVFPRSDRIAANEMVFAAAYDTLPPILSRGGSLSNATVTSSFGGSEAGHIVLHSNITFGSSGSPVLDSRGLVEGVVSRKTMIDRVVAVGAGQAKTFLATRGIRFQQDDRPQINGAASRAHRAASISARVTCLQY